MIENQTEQALPVQGVVQPQIAPQQMQQAAPQPVEEKLLKQSEVNELVQGAKQRGFQKGYQQALNEGQPQQQMAQSQPMQQQPQMAHQSMSPQEISDMAAQKVAAEFAKHHRDMQVAAAEAESTRQLNQLAAKIAASKHEFPDFDKVIGAINFAANDKLAMVVHQANTVDNSAAVLYELAKNPGKLGNIVGWNSIDPNVATAEVKKLSDSIKANQEGLNRPVPNDPLSQVKPSNIGADTGKMTVKDFKNQSWLRG